MIAQRRLGEATASLSSAFERLASGQRINQASDDAAGLAIAAKLNSDTRVYTQAIRNVNDGISALSIAQGALTALTTISVRQRELAEQAANGTYSLKQRKSMDRELNTLVDEFNRIINGTSFNQLNLIDRSLTDLRVQAGYGTNGGISFAIGNELARNVGSGTFTQSNQGSYSSEVGLSSGDVNGDGNIDIIAPNFSGGVSVHLLSSTGSVSSSANYTTPAINLFSTQTGDFNGDGKLDIAAEDTTNSKLIVLLNNGNGTFQAAVSYATTGSLGSNRGTMGDFNNDGNLDIFYSNSVFIGNGNGTFRTGVTYAVPMVTLRNSAAGDLNNDGNLDIALTDSNGSVDVLIGNGNGSFQAVKTYVTGYLLTQALTLADFNRDGNLDMAAGVDGALPISIFLGNGDGTFKAVNNTYNLGSRVHDLQAGDFNGDGISDLAAAAYGSDRFTVALGNGDGSFRAAVTVCDSTGGAGAKDFIIADLNHDSVSDIFAAAYGNFYSVLQGTTKATTTPYLDISSRQGALSAMSVIEGTLQRIGSELGAIGSQQSRLSVTLNTLAVSRENFQAAESRITDVDVAEESGQLVRSQILQRAASAVLAQANQSPALALTLLRS